MAKRVGKSKGRRGRKPKLHVISDLGTSKSQLSKHGAKPKRTISKGNFSAK